MLNKKIALILFANLVIGCSDQVATQATWASDPHIEPGIFRVRLPSGEIVCEFAKDQPIGVFDFKDLVRMYCGSIDNFKLVHETLPLTTGLFHSLRSQNGDTEITCVIMTRLTVEILDGMQLFDTEMLNVIREHFFAFTNSNAIDKCLNFDIEQNGELIRANIYLNEYRRNGGWNSSTHIYQTMDIPLPCMRFSLHADFTPDMQCRQTNDCPIPLALSLADLFTVANLNVSLRIDQNNDVCSYGNTLCIQIGTGPIEGEPIGMTCDQYILLLETIVKSLIRVHLRSSRQNLP